MKRIKLTAWDKETKKLIPPSWIKVGAGGIVYVGAKSVDQSEFKIKVEIV